MRAPEHFAVFTGKSDRRISQLDGWRGVSILLVVVGHLVRYRYGFDNSILGQTAGSLAIFGVNTFFVISGFIITKLALAECKSHGSFSIRNFYIRRAFRIVPPYFVYLACVAVASAALLIVQSLPGLFPAVVFVCNFPSANCDWFVGHTWSLAFEEQFYILFPLLVALINLHLRRFFVPLFLCLISMPFARFFLQLEGGWQTASALSRDFSIICIGSIGAIYEEELKTLTQSGYASLISIGMAILLGVILLLDAIPSIPAGSLAARIQLALNIVFVPPGLAWLIISSVHQRNRFTRVLTTTPLLFFGAISYSLYLWQQMFAAAPSYYIWKSPLPLWPLMFVVAALSYYFVERPAIRLGKRFLVEVSRTSSLELVPPKSGYLPD